MICPVYARAVPVDEALQRVTLYESRYRGWTVKPFHERWQTDQSGTRSYTWTKTRRQGAGHVAWPPRRGAHRKKRPRKPLPGMMRHQEGATHEWVAGCQGDLMVTRDDATNERYSVFFVEEEGTLSSFHGLREVLVAHCGGWRQGGQDAADAGASGVTAIGDHADSRRFAGSPRPVSARFPHPARSAAQRTGGTDMAAANRYLREQFLPAHNRRFATPAAEVGTAFVPWSGTQSRGWAVSPRGARRRQRSGIRGAVSRFHPTRIASIM